MQDKSAGVHDVELPGKYMNARQIELLQRYEESRARQLGR